MQAPRNWRMKEERYRLTGSKNAQGETSVVNRPPSLQKHNQKVETSEEPTIIAVNAA